MTVWLLTVLGAGARSAPIAELGRPAAMRSRTSRSFPLGGEVR